MSERGRGSDAGPQWRGCRESGLDLRWVMANFLTDVVTLRERARAEIEKGPITEAYGADRERVIQVLNEALATEIVCWMRYKRHYFTAKGSPAAEPIAAEL